MSILDDRLESYHQFPVEYGKSEECYHHENAECWCEPSRQIIRQENGKFLIWYKHNHVLHVRTDSMPDFINVKDAPPPRHHTGWLDDECGKSRIMIQDAVARMRSPVTIGQRITAGFKLMRMFE